MSFERARLPIMSDAIMFHNEGNNAFMKMYMRIYFIIFIILNICFFLFKARVKPHHPFSRQPDAAFQGLDNLKLVRKNSFNSGIFLIRKDSITLNR